MTILNVTNNTASGVGSLNAALQNSNSIPLADTIMFNLGAAGTIASLGGETIDDSVTLEVASHDLTISAALSGAGDLTKTGAASLMLSGTNSVVGATTVSAGALKVTSGDNLSDGAITVGSGATLQVTGAATIDNALSGSGTLKTISDSALQNLNQRTQLTLTGDNSSSNLTINATTATIVAAATSDELGHGAINLQGGALQLTSGTFDNAITLTADTWGGGLDTSGAITLTGDIAGAGNLLISGGGTTTLTGDNSGFTGSLQISAGNVVVVASDTALGASTVSVEMYAPAILRLTDGVEIANSVTNFEGTLELLAGSASISGNLRMGSSGGADINVGATADLTLSGVVSDRSSSMPGMPGMPGPSYTLDKVGDGTLTLSGISTYTLGTQVEAGTLVVNGTIVSNVGVRSGATLTGMGTINGSVEVEGTLAVGRSPGVLHTGNLNLMGLSVFAVELGGPDVGQYDQVVVTGDVELGASVAPILQLNIASGFSASTGATFVIIDNDGTDAIGGGGGGGGGGGDFRNLAEGATIAAGGYNFKISYVGGTGNDVTLTYTAPATPTPTPDPEPSTPPAQVNTPTDGADVLTTAPLGATVAAGLGDDVVTGDAGHDSIHGNQGDDRLFGGGGNDTVLGGQGDDFVHGNQGDDLLFGDKGDDSVLGGQGNDLLQGNQGDDLLFGDIGNDTIHGGQGDDIIRGGEGADYLSGDLGNDVLNGGAGADVFNFVGGTGHDVIVDFSHAQGDLIRLSAADEISFAALLSKISMQGADAVITLGSETIVLSGVPATSLTTSDFLFA